MRFFPGCCRCGCSGLIPDDEQVVNGIDNVLPDSDNGWFISNVSSFFENTGGLWFSGNESSADFLNIGALYKYDNGNDHNCGYLNYGIPLYDIGDPNFPDARYENHGLFIADESKDLGEPSGIKALLFRGAIDEPKGQLLIYTCDKASRRMSLIARIFDAYDVDFTMKVLRIQIMTVKARETFLAQFFVDDVLKYEMELSNKGVGEYFDLNLQHRVGPCVETGGASGRGMLAQAGAMLATSGKQS